MKWVILHKLKCSIQIASIFSSIKLLKKKKKYSVFYIPSGIPLLFLALNLSIFEIFF